MKKVLILLIFAFVFSFNYCAEKKGSKKELPIKTPASRIAKLFYLGGQLKYLGEVKNGKEDGKGVLFSDNGRKIYEGEFKDGVPNGQGKMYDDSEKVNFIGIVKNGIPTEDGKWVDGDSPEYSTNGDAGNSQKNEDNNTTGDEVEKTALN